MTGTTPPEPWWRILDEEENPDAPDPWSEGDAQGETPALTDEQRAFLAGLEDQPAVPRLRDLPDPEDRESTGQGTGNVPGDITEDPS